MLQESAAGCKTSGELVSPQVLALTSTTWVGGGAELGSEEAGPKAYAKVVSLAREHLCTSNATRLAILVNVQSARRFKIYSLHNLRKVGLCSRPLLFAMYGMAA